MDKLEQKEMKKIRPIKNTYHDWLFSYIPQSKRKSVGGLKDNALYEGRELTLNAFKSGMFSIKATKTKKGKDSKY